MARRRQAQARGARAARSSSSWRARCWWASSRCSSTRCCAHLHPAAFRDVAGGGRIGRGHLLAAAAGQAPAHAPDATCSRSPRGCARAWACTSRGSGSNRRNDTWHKHSTSSSSAPAPAATSPRSAPPSSASRPPASRAGRTPKGELALGGTCLNVGCIPSKALLASSEEYEKALAPPRRRTASPSSGVKFDLAKMQARKDADRHQDDQGHRVPLQEEQDHLAAGPRPASSRGGDTYTIEVRAARRVQAKHVIIATGSKARHLPGIAVDNELVCDNEGALAFAAVPEAPRRDRRGRDRPGARQRLAPPGLRGHDPRGAADFPRRLPTRRSRRRRGSIFTKSRGSTSSSA